MTEWFGEPAPPRVILILWAVIMFYICVAVVPALVLFLFEMIASIRKGLR